MNILFQKLMYHEEDLQEYSDDKALMNSKELFSKYFWAAVLVDLNRISSHAENPTYVNGVVENCTSLYLDDGTALTINTPYHVFLEFVIEYNKLYTFENVLKLFKLKT